MKKLLSSFLMVFLLCQNVFAEAIESGFTLSWKADFTNATTTQVGRDTGYGLDLDNCTYGTDTDFFNSENYIKVEMTKGDGSGYGPSGNGGVAIWYDVIEAEEALLTYYFKFSDNYVMWYVGKMPGLYSIPAPQYSAGSYYTGTDGFRGRFSFLSVINTPSILTTNYNYANSNKYFHMYPYWSMYDPPIDSDAVGCHFGYRTGYYFINGQGIYTGTNDLTLSWNQPMLKAGVWYKMAIRTKLNTVGSANGELECWVDNRKYGSWTNLTHRTATSVKVDGATLETFHGGSGETHAVTKTGYMYFADMKLYTK